MKALNVLLFFLVSVTGIAQENENFVRYYYDLEVSKVSDPNQKRNSEMILDVYEDHSYFAEKNFVAYQNELHQAQNMKDSPAYTDLLKKAGSKYKRSYYMMVKTDDDENLVYEKFKNKKFHVAEPQDEVVWETEDAVYTWNGREAKKATTICDGRTWTVLFIPGTTVESGPYKFNNLPGFVVKAWDKGNYYVFEYNNKEELNGKNVYLVKPESYAEISEHEKKLLKEVHYPDIASSKNDKSRASNVKIEDIENAIDLGFMDQISY